MTKSVKKYDRIRKKMRRRIFTVLLFYCFTAWLIISSSVCLAVNWGMEDERELEKVNEGLRAIVVAMEPLQKEVGELKAKMSELKKQIDKAMALINKLEDSIFQREVDLGVQEELLNARVRSYYKKSQEFSPLLIFLASKNATDLTRELAFRQATTNQDKKIIIKISGELADLNEDKKRLEKEKINLANVRADFDKRAVFLEGELAEAEAYRAALSQRQQSLLAEKLASLNLPTSLGAGPLYCTDDRNLDPGFSPAFAFYTFGIPHRVGMNQYGAYGRAKAGQNHEQILQEYFAGISFENRDPNMAIKVQGHGSMSLKEYVKRIYEVPDSWGNEGAMEALKAQAVAARSYVLAYTNNGAGEICTTQACQVFKPEPKGGNWEQAVNDTEGKVMVSGGQVIKAWYASTAGGYTFNSGDVWGGATSWTKRMRDTSGEVNSFGDLAANAYDKDSPCFYSAQGWRSEYGKSAWLKPEEVADIVNVLILAKADPGTQKHLSQPDKPNPDGAETWDSGRVKNELSNRGITGYGQVSDVSVGWDKGIGRTTSVNISGDAGSQSFDANEFKDYFNLRAPANIQIVGPLYKTEKKG